MNHVILRIIALVTSARYLLSIQLTAANYLKF